LSTEQSEYDRYGAKLTSWQPNAHLSGQQQMERVGVIPQRDAHARRALVDIDASVDVDDVLALRVYLRPSITASGRVRVSPIYISFRSLPSDCRH